MTIEERNVIANLLKLNEDELCDKIEMYYNSHNLAEPHYSIPDIALCASTASGMYNGLGAFVIATIQWLKEKLKNRNDKIIEFVFDRFNYAQNEICHNQNLLKFRECSNDDVSLAFCIAKILLKKHGIELDESYLAAVLILKKGLDYFCKACSCQ